MSVTLEMPKLSDTMTAGTLVKWLKSVGDPIMRGEPYADVETDKATMPLISPKDGKLIEILAIEGAVVQVGEPVAQISPREGVDSLSGPAENSTLSTPPPDEETEDVEESADEEADKKDEDDQKVENTGLIIDKDQEDEASESTHFDSREESLESSEGLVEEETEDDSRVEEQDEEAVVNMPSNEALDDDRTNEEEIVIETAIEPRGTIKEEKRDYQVTASEAETGVEEADRKLITLEKEIDASFIKKAKASINDYLLKSRKSSYENSISINDLIVCSVGKAVECIPEINCTIEKGEVKIHDILNLSFSINLPNGVVNPVIKNINSKNLMEIANESRTLIQRARDEKLEDGDESDATFSISNIGAHGIDSYKAPLCGSVSACLSVASPIKKAIIDENGAIATGLGMTLSLSCDSRSLDGSIGASFLQELAKVLENPSIATL